LYVENTSELFVFSKKLLKRKKLFVLFFNSYFLLILILLNIIIRILTAKYFKLVYERVVLPNFFSYFEDFCLTDILIQLFVYSQCFVLIVLIHIAFPNLSFILEPIQKYFWRNKTL
jgi:hypothetical protein